ncbi:hypothetical protein KTE91_03495 [Burkholderia multivorans]|uniref:hypothetical protein n=1 Tax=Burkholderia multivorans TaxID=87883 RepID=UPI001C243195|nr:hypothetical protein [Burkholderia multivorans]MBU9434147.1 hypothetical protein [Burkholderia multivorans]
MIMYWNYNVWQLKDAVKQTKLSRDDRDRLYLLIENIKCPMCIDASVMEADRLLRTLERTHKSPIFDDLIRMLREYKDGLDFEAREKAGMEFSENAQIDRQAKLERYYPNKFLCLMKSLFNK